MADIAWTLFIVASIAVIVAPGQDLVLVLSRGLGQGASAGISTAAGVSTGLMGHTLLATVGLGAVLAASDLAYLILKFAGAAYLAFLGLRLLLWPPGQPKPGQAAATPLGRLFLTGAISNISNPKITLFYFAFLPQFVVTGATSAALQIFALGTLFAALTFLIKAPVGYFAGALSNWFQERPMALNAIYRGSGLVLIGFALRLMLSERV